jgi:cytochrome c peroxidase
MYNMTLNDFLNDFGRLMNEYREMKELKDKALQEFRKNQEYNEVFRQLFDEHNQRREAFVSNFQKRQ